MLEGLQKKSSRTAIIHWQCPDKLLIYLPQFTPINGTVDITDDTNPPKHPAYTYLKGNFVSKYDKIP